MEILVRKASIDANKVGLVKELRSLYDLGLKDWEEFSDRVDKAPITPGAEQYLNVTDFLRERATFSTTRLEDILDDYLDVTINDFAKSVCNCGYNVLLKFVSADRPFLYVHKGAGGDVIDYNWYNYLLKGQTVKESESPSNNETESAQPEPVKAEDLRQLIIQAWSNQQIDLAFRLTDAYSFHFGDEV